MALLFKVVCYRFIFYKVACYRFMFFKIVCYRFVVCVKGLIGLFLFQRQGPQNTLWYLVRDVKKVCFMISVYFKYLFFLKPVKFKRRNYIFSFVISIGKVILLITLHILSLLTLSDLQMLFNLSAADAFQLICSRCLLTQCLLHYSLLDFHLMRFFIYIFFY